MRIYTGLLSVLWLCAMRAPWVGSRSLCGIKSSQVRIYTHKPRCPSPQAASRATVRDQLAPRPRAGPLRAAAAPRTRASDRQRHEARSDSMRSTSSRVGRYINMTIVGGRTGEDRFQLSPKNEKHARVYTKNVHQPWPLALKYCTV